MEFQKIVNLLDMTSFDSDVPRFGTKIGLKFMTSLKRITVSIKKLELKEQIYVILVMQILL